jgi:DNA-binding beta-propeller fold protein YncE
LKDLHAHIYTIIGPSLHLHLLFTGRNRMKRPSLYPILLALLALASCEQPNEPAADKLGSISGLVLDQATEAPIVGAEVRALINEVADTTDSLGAFLLDSLALGDETLIVTTPWYDTSYTALYIQDGPQEVTLSPKPSLENLYLYLGTWAWHYLYIVDVDNRANVDTLYFAPGTINELTMSPGGTKLYITTHGNSGTYYLDTKTFSFNQTNLPHGKLMVSPYNQELYLFTNDGMFVVDTLSDAAIQIDTLTSFRSLAFNPAAPVIYFTRDFHGHAVSSDLLLHEYDYVSRTIVQSLPLYPYELEVTPDGSEIYFLDRVWKIGVLDLMDHTISSISGADTIDVFGVNRANNIIITPDGKHALLIDAWDTNWASELGPTGLVQVINTDDHYLEAYIDLYPVVVSGRSAERIVITPSGRYAFISNGRRSVFVIDIQTQLAIASIHFESIGGSIRPMAIGPKYR